MDYVKNGYTTQHLEQHENKGTKRRINSQNTLQGFYKATPFSN